MGLTRGDVTPLATVLVLVAVAWSLPGATSASAADASPTTDWT